MRKTKRDTEGQGARIMRGYQYHLPKERLRDRLRKAARILRGKECNYVAADDGRRVCGVAEKAEGGIAYVLPASQNARGFGEGSG